METETQKNNRKVFNRRCKMCGVMMYGVGASRQYCESCQAEAKLMHPETAETSAKKRHASIKTIVKLATAAGLSYGEYLTKYGEPKGGRHK